MEESRKQKMVRDIKEWLAQYYKDFKGVKLSDEDLNRVFSEWCLKNNLKQLVNK